MKWILKFASRNRPGFFMQGIKNLNHSFKGNDYVILATLDVDDPTMNNKEIDIFCESAKNVKILWGRSESKIHAINRGIYPPYNWDILMNFSDDMLMTVEGWNEIMERQIKEVWGDSLDFFAHYNDGYAGDALATMSIMGRTYYERTQYIYHPGYKSFSSDAEAYYVARALGRHHYFSDVLFLHQHPTNSPNPKDALYQKNSLATPHDTKFYWERLNNDFGLTNLKHPTPWEAYYGKQPK